MQPFLDKFFAEQMPKYKVPGAVFVLVKDGIIFSSENFNYGFFRRDGAGERKMFYASGHQFGNVNSTQLVPLENAAFFLSLTHGGIEEKRDLRAAFAAQFMTRYFGKK